MHARFNNLLSGTDFKHVLSSSVYNAHLLLELMPEIFRNSFWNSANIRYFQMFSFCVCAGITGTVSIDENGDRNADYSLLDMNPETGIFEVSAYKYGCCVSIIESELLFIGCISPIVEFIKDIEPGAALVRFKRWL